MCWILDLITGDIRMFKKNDPDVVKLFAERNKNSRFMFLERRDSSMFSFANFKKDHWLIEQRPMFDNTQGYSKRNIIKIDIPQHLIAKATAHQVLKKILDKDADAPLKTYYT